MISAVLERLLYRPDGSVRARRLVGTLVVLIAVALLGSFLIALTPRIDDPLLQGGWVLFAVFLLKLPLVALLFWLITRNLEWPTRRPRWSEEEVEDIIGYLRSEIDRAEAYPDAERRLAYLLGEAWHVADHSDGERKGEAVGVALEIDARLQTRRRRTHRQG
jgi:hypothetical protein